MSCFATAATTTSPNILFIVVDDLGIEVLDNYNSGGVATTAPTPNIDRLARRGVTFDNVWGAPLSAPARAEMLTGRYGFNTGIVALDIELSTRERTLHSSLPKSYANSLIGKWHLSKRETSPESYGIDYFAGFLATGGVRDYSQWQLTQNGRTSLCNEYITSKLTDLALDWISEQSKPWFCWLAYNAPHTPYHLPPSKLHTQRGLKDNDASIESNPFPYFVAMIESLDHEIGRLLDGIPATELENTVVIFIGDNGTAREVIQSPYSSSEGKGTIFEGGVRIPLIVSGAGVNRIGERETALISATDIFATVMELAGEDMPRYEDSFSFKPLLNNSGSMLRRFSYAEIFNRRSGYYNTLRDHDYKLVVLNGEPTMFFTFEPDGTEGENLLGRKMTHEQESAYKRLLGDYKALNNNFDYSSIQQSRPPQRGGAQNSQQPRLMRQGGGASQYGSRPNRNF